MAISGGLAFLGGVAEGVNEQYDAYYKEAADMRKLQAALDVERYKTKKKTYDDNKEVWDILQPVVIGEVTGEPAFRLVQGVIDPEGKKTEVLRQMFNNNTIHHYLKSFEPGDEPSYESRNDLTEPYKITNHPLSKLRANIFGEPTTTTDARAILFKRQAAKIDALNPEGKQIAGKLDLKTIERGGTLLGVDAEGNAKVLGKGQPYVSSSDTPKGSNFWKVNQEEATIRQNLDIHRARWEEITNNINAVSETLGTMPEDEKQRALLFITEQEKELESLNPIIQNLETMLGNYQNYIAGYTSSARKEEDELGGERIIMAPKAGVGAPIEVAKSEKPQSELAQFNENLNDAIDTATTTFNNAQIAAGNLKRPQNEKDFALPAGARSALTRMYKEMVEKGEIDFAEIENHLANSWRVYNPRLVSDPTTWKKSNANVILVPKDLDDARVSELIGALRDRNPEITSEEITIFFNHPDTKKLLALEKQKSDTRKALGVP